VASFFYARSQVRRRAFLVEAHTEIG
jgi:hypothetical protein